MKRIGQLSTRLARARAFTRVDLLGCIATSFVLAMAVLPSLGTGVDQGREVICRENMRTLIRGWQMYADDNRGRLVENYHGASWPNFRNAPWASGWLDWGTSSDNTNRTFLLDPKYARLASYLPKESRAHKCPEDNYVSEPQRNRQMSERVRTVAMNITVGDGNAPTGPWDPAYEQVRTIDGFRYPPASGVAVFVEEHPDSINDPAFFPPRRTDWVDVPGTLHNGASTLAFGDGRVETHRWKGSARGFSILVGPLSSPFQTPEGDPDIAWMRYHSARYVPEI